MPTTCRTIEGDMVDAIAHRHYGDRPGTSEAIWQANRGLARYPMVLPEGLILILPDLEDVPAIRTVKLYD